MVWDVLDVACNILDVVWHWRFYLCFLSSLALAFLIHRSLPDPATGFFIVVAVGATGFIVGLVWELRS